MGVGRGAGRPCFLWHASVLRGVDKSPPAFGKPTTSCASPRRPAPSPAPADDEAEGRVSPRWRGSGYTDSVLTKRRAKSSSKKTDGPCGVVLCARLTQGRGVLPQSSLASPPGPRVGGRDGPLVSKQDEYLTSITWPDAPDEQVCQLTHTSIMWTTGSPSRTRSSVCRAAASQTDTCCLALALTVARKGQPSPLRGVDVWMTTPAARAARTQQPAKATEYARAADTPRASARPRTAVATPRGGRDQGGWVGVAGGSRGRR